MKPETFCDNCADVLNLKDAVIFGACPFPTASTHAGESATLCKACAHPPAPNISPMKNQNTPTPSGTPPGAASAGSGNSSGRELRAVVAPVAGMFLEVWNTNERGELSDLVLSCFVEEHETPAEAVVGLLAEFMHPFGAAWESPEQYGRELDAVKWLAEFYGVPTEGGSK